MGLNSLIGEVAAVERYSTLQNYPCVKVLKERKNKCFIERCIPILQGPSSCYLRKKKKFNSQVICVNGSFFIWGCISAWQRY